MWDRNHIKNEGYFAHLLRALKMAGLLVVVAACLVPHAILPFWQQPKRLCLQRIMFDIRDDLKSRKRRRRR
tara:strand:- start:165 stop:377 length:213 start_codon:yes stop_codon:yes gene_type:complete